VRADRAHFVDIDICAAGRIARFWKLDASP
jgi:hypothetical protein